jgi:hypothetical protein
MYPSGEPGRIREKFRNLRREEEALAPPFERTWRAARSRARRPHPARPHALAVAAALCACAALVAVFVPPHSPVPRGANRATNTAVAEPRQAPAPPLDHAENAAEGTAGEQDAPATLISDPDESDRPDKQPRAHRKRRAAPPSPCAEC